MPDDPILQTTIDVTVDGANFIFKIPSFADEIKIGLRAKQIRRELELELLGPNPTPEQAQAFTGGESTYDGATEGYVRTAAYFSVLLKQSSVEWIYSKNDKGSPICNYKEWPNSRVDTIMRAGVEFSNQLNRFRSGGTTAPKSPVDKVVDSQQNTEDQSIQPSDAGSLGTAA